MTISSRWTLWTGLSFLSLGTLVSFRTLNSVTTETLLSSRTFWTGLSLRASVSLRSSRTLGALFALTSL